MSVRHIQSLPEFNDVLRAAGPKLVVVDFHATWCGPCHAIAPRFEQLARQYTGRAIFLKVDVDAAEDVARHFNISAMPTFHFHLRSRLVDEISGADPDALADTIARHAPAAADVSFSGEGQRLSAGTPSSSSSAPLQSARQSAAAAAASRMEANLAARAATAQNPTQSNNTPLHSLNKPSSIAEAPKQASPEKSNTSEDRQTQNDARLKVNETFLNQMVNDMGFPRLRAEKALILTGNSGLEAAVEWCFEHADEPDVDEPLQVVTKEGAPKPKLSPEEAKVRADELMRRAREKREQEEKKDALERERERLRSGKEANAARLKLEEQERKRVVEQKRREKREALAERQRVREMLEADKQRRHERFNMGSAIQKGTTQLAPKDDAVQPVSQPPAASASAGKIQFRMPDGSRLEGEFEAAQTVGDLVSFLVAKNPGLNSQSMTLSQQYPRRVFSQADYSRSLADLKLLPRGALTVSF